MRHGINIERVRDDTPGCTEVIHLNNAGAGLMPRPVLEATVGMLELEARIGGYEAAAAWDDRLERAYDAIVALINAASRDEIAVVENATRAFDMAFYSIDFKPGDKILTSVSEYASNVISYLQVARKTGAEVVVVPNDEHGQMSIAALGSMLDDSVRLVSVSHIPTNGGLVQPVAEIGALVEESRALFLVDACQSVGQVPVDVRGMHIDMLSATSRKYLRGPRGVGFLYVREDLIEELEPPFLDLHAAIWVAPDRYEIRADARRFENWETNFAGKVGMGVAIDYALDVGIEPASRRIAELASVLRTRIEEIPGGRTHDLGDVKGGIVTFTVEGLDPRDIQTGLRRERINVNTSGVTSTRFDMTQRGLDMMVRASVHYYNTEDEIGRAVDIVRSMQRRTT
jgi:cysteine desulfurase / selenocysteine lyase